MVTPRGFIRPAIYGTGKAARPTTSAVRGKIQELFDLGQGVTEIRTKTLRLKFLDGKPVKASNRVITGVVRELKEIQAKEKTAAKFTGAKLPTKGMIVQSGVQFAHNYKYFATVVLRSETMGRNFDRVPVTFEDDRLLTATEIRERSGDVGMQVALKGGRGMKAGLRCQADLVVQKVIIHPIQRSG